jgi:hypothetical protein
MNDILKKKIVDFTRKDYQVKYSNKTINLYLAGGLWQLSTGEPVAHKKIKIDWVNTWAYAPAVNPGPVGVLPWKVWEWYKYIDNQPIIITDI